LGEQDAHHRKGQPQSFFIRKEVPIKSHQEAKKSLLPIIIGFAAAAASGVVAAGKIRQNRLRKAFPPPGEMIDLGDYRVHLNRQGEGQPVIVLESGLGGDSLDWCRVQPEIAKTTTVISYDRPGLGWSDRSPYPRLALPITDELHRLLQNAGLPGPYVLVGHSGGGLYVRMFAHQHPELAAGMVLVDSAHEHHITRSSAVYRQLVQDFESGMVRRIKMLSLINRTGFFALFPQLAPVVGPHFPPEIQKVQRAITVMNSRVAATLAEEWENIQATFAQAREMNITSLNDIPLIVLQARQLLQADPSIGFSPAVAEQVNQVFEQAQLELAALSPQGRKIVVEGSGHQIQLEQPQAVIDAILEVVERVRAGKEEKPQMS
jgi:pimeloyl-ACP methyl ester carboxylesterase